MIRVVDVKGERMKKLTVVFSLLTVLLVSGAALADDPYGGVIESTVSNPVVLTFSFIIWFAIIAVFVAAQWKLFTKAGEPGWAAVVPVYNLIILMKIAGKPDWWIVLLFVPFAGIVATIVMYIGLARNFGRSGGFAVGLIFLPFIFMLILAFGSSRYLPVA
jgi:hypothetical protein